MKPLSFLLMTIFLCFTSCVHKQALTYVPVTEKTCTNNIMIALEDIQDHRRDKESIGCNRNLYYMPLWKVQSIQSPQSWISYALEQELLNAGYIITFSNPPGTYKVRGDIYNFFIDSYFLVKVDIKIGISLLKNDQVIFNKNYEINQRVSIVSSLTYEGYLQEICKEFIADLKAYFKNLEESSNISL